MRCPDPVLQSIPSHAPPADPTRVDRFARLGGGGPFLQSDFVFPAAGSFRQSSAFILAGHVVFTLPFMVRSIMAVLGAIDVNTLEEGAASLGASRWRRFIDVIVPNTKPGILPGPLMVVTFSLGEFNLTWMLYTPLTKTLPVGLADSYASMRLEVASAYTLIFFIMIIPLLIAMQVVGQSNTRTRAA